MASPKNSASSSVHGSFAARAVFKSLIVPEAALPSMCCLPGGTSYRYKSIRLFSRMSLGVFCFGGEMRKDREQT